MSMTTEAALAKITEALPNERFADAIETIRTALSVPLGMGEDMPERTSSAAARQHAPDIEDTLRDQMLLDIPECDSSLHALIIDGLSSNGRQYIEASEMADAAVARLAKALSTAGAGEHSGSLGGEDADRELMRLRTLKKQFCRYFHLDQETEWSQLINAPSAFGIELDRYRNGDFDTQQAPDSRGVALEWKMGHLYFKGRYIGQVTGTNRIVTASLCRETIGTFPDFPEAREALETAAREWLSIPLPATPRKDEL